MDGLKAQINLLSEEISNAEVAKSKNEKLIKKHEKTRLEAEKEGEQLSTEIERLEEDVKNQANDASGSRQQAEDAQEVSSMDSADETRTDYSPSRHSRRNAEKSKPSSRSWTRRRLN